MSPPDPVVRRKRSRSWTIDTPFFALLDDDDETLPGALRYQRDHIQGADVLITNGFVCEDGRDRRAFQNLEVVPRDPIGHLLGANNWVHGGGALYRTARVP